MRKKSMHLLLAILFLAVGSAIPIGSQAADFFNKKDFEVAIGFQYDSLLYKRGIITYDAYQVVPVFSVQLFNPNLLIAGSALYYKYEFNKSINLRARINMDATGDEPLYYTDEEEGDRIRRETTSELDIYLEYFSDSLHHLRFQVSQDLVEHKGTYLELHSRIALFSIYPWLEKNSASLALASIFASIGYGDEEHNEYLYGAGADKAGTNNYEYGLMITSPKVIDSFWPTLKVTQFAILGDENKAGSFVKEKDGFSVQLLMAKRVW